MHITATPQEIAEAAATVRATPYSVIVYHTSTPAPNLTRAHRAAIGWTTSEECEMCGHPSDDTLGTVTTYCCCGTITPMHPACRDTFLQRITCPLHGDEPVCRMCHR